MGKFGMGGRTFNWGEVRRHNADLPGAFHPHGVIRVAPLLMAAPFPMTDDQRPTWCHAQIIYMTASLVSSIYLMKWAIGQLDPNRSQLESAKKRQKELEAQLGRPLLKLQGLEAVSGGGISCIRPCAGGSPRCYCCNTQWRRG